MSDECLASYVFPHLPSSFARREQHIKTSGNVSNDIIPHILLTMICILTFKGRYFFRMCLGARGEERHTTYDDGRMRGGHANWSHRHLRSNSIEEASSSECVSDFAIPILLPSSHPPTT